MLPERKVPEHKKLTATERAAAAAASGKSLDILGGGPAKKKGCLPWRRWRKTKPRASDSSVSNGSAATAQRVSVSREAAL
jgi:hypothetical protein